MVIFKFWKVQHDTQYYPTQENKEQRYAILESGQGHIEAFIHLSICTILLISFFKIYIRLNDTQIENTKHFHKKWHKLESKYGN